MRRLVMVAILLAAVVTPVYADAMSGSTKPLGGGSSPVAHCQVLDYSIAASDTISSVNAQVKCDVTGSYIVTATVASGINSGSGQQSASLTAGTPQTVAVSISPSVPINGSTYSTDLLVKQ